MIEIPIKPEWKKAAVKEAESIGKLSKSITQGDGNMAGVLGEIVISDYLGIQIDNTRDHDVITKDGKTSDVKTKRCKFRPKPGYTVSVCALNTHQKCDNYIFVRIDNDLTTSWVLGYMPKDEFYKKAKFCKKGEPDPDSHCGFLFKEDCYNMYIHELKPIKELKNYSSTPSFFG